MQQLSLLDYQPEPELMEESQSSTLFRQGDRHTVQPCKPPTKAINEHAIAWQEGNIAYYRKLMLRFMELQRLDVAAGTDTLQKQVSRRHMISHLQGLCEECLIKINQSGGE